VYLPFPFLFRPLNGGVHDTLRYRVKSPQGFPFFQPPKGGLDNTGFHFPPSHFFPSTCELKWSRDQGCPAVRRGIHGNPDIEAPLFYQSSFPRFSRASCPFYRLILLLLPLLRDGVPKEFTLNLPSDTHAERRERIPVFALL